MASVRKTPGGRYELSVRSKLLPKPWYRTFDIEADAIAYGEQVDRLLSAGVVPADMVETPKPAVDERLRFVIVGWINSGQPARTDVPVLDLLAVELAMVPIKDLTYKWAESWVRSLKIERNFSPGTIRKRIASLSRALAWWMRTHPDSLASNPLLLLPKGISHYNDRDAEEIAALAKTAKPHEAAPVVKVDKIRERRLEPGEIGRILASLDGVRRRDRERPLQLIHGRELRVLFLLIHYTGLRLREAYTLTRGQIDLARRSINVRSSKQRRNKVAYRPVPIRPELGPILDEYLATVPAAASTVIFPWWDGERTEESMEPVTKRLTQQFRRLFEYSQCPGLTEHDLRHEATCQWFEMRLDSGAWVFRETEIAKIMGWAPGSPMPARYASFRAEDLASRMDG